MTTFVTAFLDLFEDRSKDKSVATCFAHFTKLASTDIPLVVFLSKKYADLAPIRPNVKYIYLELTDLITYSEAMAQPLKQPANHTDYHDTLNFMILMNAKIEFVHRAMAQDPFASSHFAWIDFSICHVFRELDNSLNYLKMLSQTALKDQFLALPGCWSKGAYQDQLFSAVNWRFCGGFFIGDRASLENFYNEYRAKFPTYLKTTNTMVWEVNIWHRLELDGLHYDWFAGGHDDSIIRVPPSLFRIVASLTTIPSRIEGSCRAAIDSLLPQVDHVYLNLAHYYERFQTSITVPEFFKEHPYKDKVSITLCDDKGPATKYVGALGAISPHDWIFFCDDDQEYAPDLIAKMRSRIDTLCVYQNRFEIIKDNTSGGLIHGFVGNLGHASLYRLLPAFHLPVCALHVDDQWLSIYCFLNGITIRPSGVEAYHDIFKRLEQGHECIGLDSLFSLGTRENRVQQLAEEFKVRFVAGGIIQRV